MEVSHHAQLSVLSRWTCSQKQVLISINEQLINIFHNCSNVMSHIFSVCLSAFVRPIYAPGACLRIRKVRSCVL